MPLQWTFLQAWKWCYTRFQGSYATTVARYTVWQSVWTVGCVCVFNITFRQRGTVHNFKAKSQTSVFQLHTLSHLRSSCFSVCLRGSLQRFSTIPLSRLFIPFLFQALLHSRVFISKKLQRIETLRKDGGGRPVGMKDKSSLFQREV